MRGSAVANHKPPVREPRDELFEVCSSVWEQLDRERRRLVQRVREAVRRGEYRPCPQDVGAAVLEWLVGRHHAEEANR